mmetsp:Transcript_22507/g.61754  ORF Transcript_22507/g.61754 Transcript_22507/m.61754 type:complete len:195 (+) Transcript_22507:1655-2239(+)
MPVPRVPSALAVQDSSPSDLPLASCSSRLRARDIGAQRACIVAGGISRSIMGSPTDGAVYRATCRLAAATGRKLDISNFLGRQGQRMGAVSREYSYFIHTSRSRGFRVPPSTLRADTECTLWRGVVCCVSHRKDWASTFEWATRAQHSALRITHDVSCLRAPRASKGARTGMSASTGTNRREKGERMWRWYTRH